VTHVWQEELVKNISISKLIPGVGPINYEILDKRLPDVKAMYAGLVAGTDPENAKIADTRIPRLMVDLLQNIFSNYYVIEYLSFLEMGGVTSAPF
jgi:hypothetical protein